MLFFATAVLIGNRPLGFEVRLFPHLKMIDLMDLSHILPQRLHISNVCNGIGGLLQNGITSERMASSVIDFTIEM